MSTAADPEGAMRNPNPKSDPGVVDPEAKPDRVPYFWMVKPCFVYKDEYKDCRSFKDRFHQRYVHGEFRECGQWKVDHENCLKWEKDKDTEALQRVIASEKDRVKQRLKAHYANDVWEHREHPPSDWNKELPEDILRSYEDSYLKTKSDELKGDREIVPEPEYVFSGYKCSIM